MSANGVINLHEYVYFARAWLSHDPDDPAWLADPNLADPNLSEGWYEWKHKFNLDNTGLSAYQIDLADLLMFLEEAPWLWTACWLDLQEAQSQQMMAGGEEMLMMGEAEPMFLETQLASEKTVLEQVAELASTIVQLENLWLTEAEIWQEIDAADWQRFVEAVYETINDLAIETIQIE